MNTVITYFALLVSGILLSQNTIEVTITNFESNDGTAMIAVYDSEGNFLNKRFKGAMSPVNDKKATITFKDIPDGTYAVSSFHDENDNGEFDMFLGMFPSEDYATSNNAKGNFGPPKWADAKFEVKGGEVKKIALLME